MHGGPVVLDGGMGHQLRNMGVEIKGEIGTMERFLGVATANTSNPALVTEAHLAFIDAGANVITTNNYAVVPSCLKLCTNYQGTETITELLAAAGRAAQEARKARPDRDIKVAGCLPPLNESYRADRVGTFEENLVQYRIISSSIAPFSDVLLCETMSTAQEARAAVTAALASAITCTHRTPPSNRSQETGLPVWVSWTLDEDSPVLRSGETIHAALEVSPRATINLLWLGSC